MKKIKLSLLAVIALTAAISMSAFTSAKQPRVHQDPLYWFDATTNDYLDLHQTLDDIEMGFCDGSGNPCAKGYSDADFTDPDDVQPIGLVQEEVEKE